MNAKFLLNPIKKTQKNGGRRRKNAAPIWRRFWFGGLFSATFLISASLGSWWLISNNWIDNSLDKIKWKTISLLSKSGFKLSEILVVGRVQTSEKALLQVMRLGRGAPILTYDLKAARQRIEELPWVRYARVERMLPDKIFLSLEESLPLAVWQNKGKFSLIDERGDIIRNVDLKKFKDLMVVVGKGAAKNTAELFSLLETQPELKRLVKTAVWIGGRRWNLRMLEEIKVRLPEKNADDALARLAEYEKLHQILGQNIKTVDLRFPDRLVINKGSKNTNINVILGQET